MTDWISVKDRFPDDNQSILVYGKLECTNEMDIHKAVFYMGINRELGRNEFWESDFAYDITEATHWMPLPEPPK